VFISPDGTRAYVTNDGKRGVVPVIDTGANQVVANISVGGSSLAIAFVPTP